MIYITTLQAQSETLSELPDNPESGKCYVKHVNPDQYETKSFRVVEVPAHKTLQIIPAEYKVEREEVVVKPASKNYKFIPATYKTTIDTFWIEEPHNEITTSKAVFKDDYEVLEFENKSGKWMVKKARDCNSPNPDDCQVYHYNEETPVVVDKIPVKKLYAPAKITSKKVVGGKYKLIERNVLVTPARIVEAVIPEEKEVVERRKLIKDETVREISVPAKYRTVEKRVFAKKGGVVWKEVPCDSDPDSDPASPSPASTSSSAISSKSSMILPINYAVGSVDLTSESKSIIDKHILPKLKAEKSVVVVVGSHTDSRGSTTSNQRLSEGRSKSVIKYLSQKGIKSFRMIAIGYGESQLLNDCKDGVKCTEKKHALNRRTEFKFY